MKQLTKIEIIESIMEIYINDPSQRSIDDDGTCLYNGPNGTHCAVGQCLLPEYQEQGTELKKNYANIDNLVLNNSCIYLDDMLQGQYRGHSEEFWEDMQRMHDASRYWNSNGLTSVGEKEFSNLKQYWG